jgi:hypothetical protein
MDAKALKDRIVEARRARRRVPAQRRAATMEYVEQRQAAGISMKAIGEDLGMSSHTLSYWRARHAGSSTTSLARVKVVAAERSDQVGVVHGRTRTVDCVGAKRLLRL